MIMNNATTTEYRSNTVDAMTPADESALRQAFERVQNQDHWKGPIDAVVVCKDCYEGAMIADAVEFYTATQATLKVLRAVPGKYIAYHVTAPGYWAGPAA